MEISNPLKSIYTSINSFKITKLEYLYLHQAIAENLQSLPSFLMLYILCILATSFYWDSKVIFPQIFYATNI